MEEMIECGGVFFNGFAAGDQEGFVYEMKLVWKGAQVVGDARGELGLRFGESLIDQEQDAVCSVFMESVEGFGEQGLGRVEEVGGEMNGVFKGYAELLVVGEDLG